MSKILQPGKYNAYFIVVLFVLTMLVFVLAYTDQETDVHVVKGTSSPNKSVSEHSAPTEQESERGVQSAYDWYSNNDWDSFYLAHDYADDRDSGSHAGTEDDHEHYRQWIIKWKEDYSEPKPDGFKIIHSHPKRNIMLIELYSYTHFETWFEKWSERSDIEFMQPNYKVTLNAWHDPKSDQVDPANEHTEGGAEDLGFSYLNQVRADQLDGQDFGLNEDQLVTIAVLDTGVETSHPYLQDYLLEGFSVIDSEPFIRDRLGHGTQVTGVVVQSAIVSTGLKEAIRILPIKVLGAVEDGTHHDLMNGIFEAVDHGADVIVLSLEEPFYSRSVLDAIEYAEAHGVLVVAAAGNKGMMTSSPVSYPAAYPTVIAVGAVTANNEPAPYSNQGPEINVVAPGGILTSTNIGRDFQDDLEGTSYAAPQVAALAALIINKYPELTPAQVRNHIQYTSLDIHHAGWDAQTGFGLVDFVQALSTEPIAHIYAEMQLNDQPAPFPIENKLYSELRHGEDQHLFTTTAPYDGKLKLNVGLYVGKFDGVDVTVYQDEDGERMTYTVNKEESFEFEVSEGEVTIIVQYNAAEKRTTPLPYHMINTFTMYEDEQHPNGSRNEATQMFADGRVYIGTFSREHEEDWFYFDVPSPGVMDIRITGTTVRMDHYFYVEKPGGARALVDRDNYVDLENNNNLPLEWISLDVEEGRYYIQVMHDRGRSGSIVTGEYILEMSFQSND